MTTADLRFYPWMRRGASRALTSVGVAKVSLTVNAHEPLDMLVAIAGPGHVAGLDRRQVIRTDPVDGSQTFEPNYLPLIEFDEAAMPWLFTPMPAASTDSKLQPWLCLAVVRLQPGVRLDPPVSGPLPVLTIDRPVDAFAELPDLSDSWAWAHGQLTSPESGSADVLTDAKKYPERTLSRLLCSRILSPDTAYLACVVPTFAAGRKAGLGETLTEGDWTSTEPAWAKPPAQPAPADEPPPVRLPVYYSWEFRTGAGGDFRSLALLLKAPLAIPEKLGVKAIDVSATGLTKAALQGVELALEGALRPRREAPIEAWPSDAARTSWETALRPVINAPAQVKVDDDPLLAPPLYGGVAAGLDQADEQHPDRWFEQLNLSPAYRAIAHFGARVVAANQDSLMASAWDQAADLQKVNQLLRQTQFGARVSKSLIDRHMKRMAPDKALMVMAPAQKRMSLELEGLRFATALRETGVQSAAFSTSFRRMARTRGGSARRLNRVADTPISAASAVSVLSSLRRMRFVKPPPPLAGGPITLEQVASHLHPRREDITWREATDSGVLGGPASPGFSIRPPAGPVFPAPPPPPTSPTPPADVGPHFHVSATVLTGILHDIVATDTVVGVLSEGDGAPPQDNAAARQFRELAAKHLQRTNRPIIMMAEGPTIPVAPLDGADPFAKALDVVLEASRPEVTFKRRLDWLVTRAPKVAGSAPDKAPTRPPEPLDPIGLSPYFPQPMVEALSEIAQDLVLPGLELVPANAVLGVETNPAFIEAYMIGLNHEMGRELVWRRYPADLTATYFDHFWRSPMPPMIWPAAIDPIAAWGDRSLSLKADDPRFVLLIRSELLVRYPNAVVILRKDGADNLPIFSGGFAPDVRYMGFDIAADSIGGATIIIQEHPSAPRFNIPLPLPGATPLPGPAPIFLAPEGESSAAVASKLRVSPVRISLPTSLLKALGPH